MLKYIDETGMYLEINGFRKVEIGDPTNFLKDLRRLVPKGNFVQFFDAELIATWQHLYFAALNGLLAFKDGNNISKTAQMEIVLYSAAQRQIEKAIKAVGLKQKSFNVAILVAGENPSSVKELLYAISNRIGKDPDEAVLELTKEKIQKIRQLFKISDAEIEAVLETDFEKALINLIIERMALLVTQI